jgi:hypothetical protein
MAYQKNGNRELAVKELSASLKINPNFPEAEKARAALQELNKNK